MKVTNDMLMNSKEISVFSFKTSDDYGILVSSRGNSKDNVNAMRTLKEIKEKISKISRDDICISCFDRDTVEQALMQQEATLMDLHLLLSSEGPMHMYNILASKVTRMLYNLNEESNENLTTVLYKEEGVDELYTLVLDLFNNTGYVYINDQIPTANGEILTLAKPVKSIRFTTEDLMLTLLNDIIIRINMSEQGENFMFNLADMENSARLLLNNSN